MNLVSKFRNQFLAAFAILGMASLLFVDLNTAGARELSAKPVGARAMKIVSTSGIQGQQVNVVVELDSQGDELGFTFTLVWDPLIFNSPVVTLGAAPPAGGNIFLNSTQVAQGRLGVIVDFSSPFTASPPNREVVKVAFNIAANAPVGDKPINFMSLPTPMSIANTQGGLASATYETGTITVNPSATLVTVAGRVTTPGGQSLRNALVNLVDANNFRRVANTNNLGIFTFADVPTGAYTVSVSSKRYRFAPREVTINSAITDMTFVGLE